MYLNAISCLSIHDQSDCDFPKGEVQVYMCTFWWGNMVLLMIRFFDMEKFATLTPLSLLCWCKLSFPMVGLKIPFLQNFALKSHNRIFILYFRKWLKKNLQFLIKLSFWVITFLLCWYMWMQNNDVTPVTSQHYIWHPITNKLCSFNCWYYSLVYKILFAINDFHSFSIEKIIVPYSYSASLVPPNLQYTHQI